jgi:hypothetical protein
MRLGHVFSVVLVGGMSLATNAHADCRLQFEQHFICDQAVLQGKLAQAKVIGVVAGRTDLFATERTGQLVTKLGKQVATADQHTDMTFEVLPVEHNGSMSFGPQGMPLGRFNVYDADHQLVWVETIDGNGEMPWTADVIELIKRFQAHVAGSKEL